MCRVLAYLGDPVQLDGVLFEASNSCVRPSVQARLMSLLNIGGFGLVAWDDASPRRFAAAFWRDAVRALDGERPLPRMSVGAGA